MNRRLIVLAIAALATSAACSFFYGLLPQRGSEPVVSDDPLGAVASTETTPVADYYDVDGNPVDFVPPPQEAVEMMLARVEAGELKLEQGVLDLMRALAGEAALPAYAQQAEGGMEFESVWGLSLLAYDVYHQTEDPALRSELTRLHRVLAPPRAALQQYGMPADQVEALETPSGGALELQIDCSEIWHEGFPESAGPSPTCVLYDGFPAGGYEFFVYYPVEMQNDPQMMGYIKAALQALKDSQQRYSEWVEVRSIDVVFSLVTGQDIGAPPDIAGIAMVPGFSPNEFGDRACPITVLQGVRDRTEDQLKQIIAHEVFHCVHVWRKGHSGYESSSWYNEGMAEYFSNVVYPAVNNETKAVHRFHANSIEKSIFEMSYGNVVFFQYLGNRFGNEWLIQLLDGMPDSDPGAMLSYMNSQSDMDEVFHDFARAYMDGTILDTGGGPLPGSPLIPADYAYIMPDHAPFKLEAKPFHVERASVIFDVETRFELSLVLDGDGATESARRGGTQVWIDFPEAVTTCAAPTGFVQILTTTTAADVAPNAVGFEVEVEEDEENDCDECLVGVWERQVAESDYWDKIMADTANDSTYLDSVMGTQRLVFDEEGTYTSVTEGWQTVWTGQSVAGNVTQVITNAEGSTSGSYSTYEEGLLQLIEQSHQFDAEMVSVVSGPLGTFSTDPQPVGEASGYEPMTAEGAPYECEGDTLKIFTEDPGWDWSGFNVFTRLSDDPNAAANGGPAP